MGHETGKGSLLQVAGDDWQELIAAMDSDLHDLSQPLTALQCRLELGRMFADPAALLEAVDGALEETRRMFVTVEAMRSRLRRLNASERAARTESTSDGVR